MIVDFQPTCSTQPQHLQSNNSTAGLGKTLKNFPLQSFSSLAGMKRRKRQRARYSHSFI